ncbi:MAG: phosphoribosylaminoimidazolecarboxamide formyltransferase [Oscillospiraceae bacterium]|nr:phosphoribosylaminoimidazolecarboxamide formyltransferase [Oscillospiraceae bacterium]
MKELELKYGCNPNQKPARIYSQGELPFEVLNGKPGYINFMDALNGWQLVRELKAATGLPAAASFKHVSPAGAAVGVALTDILKKIYWVDDLEGIDDSLLACAYARARGADRMSSFGDFAALSDTCDVTTAKFLSTLVSDGVIAPDYEPAALEILKAKRKGGYNIIKIEPRYEPEMKSPETKQIFGITFEQNRNDTIITPSLLENIPTRLKNLPDEAKTDLIISLITLKYTQSNSVCYAYGGQAIGIGAGQQSRIHCTRLAGDKADNWYLRQNPKVMGLKFLDSLKPPEKDNAIDLYTSDDCINVLADGQWQNIFSQKPEEFTSSERRSWLDTLSGVSLGSDAFFPFGDNIDRAAKSGVKYIAQPGGSVRDDHVIKTCNQYDMVMAFTGLRLFHH